MVLDDKISKILDKIYLSYDDITSMCESIASDIKLTNPDIIVGITRGGLIPAVHLSHILDVPMTTLCWQTRDESVQEEKQDLIEMIDSGLTVVFVDDINDSGRTFSEISQLYDGKRDNVHFFSLVQKASTEFFAPAALTFDDERWIVFPFEKE